MPSKVFCPIPAFFSFTTALLVASPSLAASWQNNVNYGGNGGPSMDLYVPDAPDDSPGIIVALHYCGGNSGATHGWFESLADEHGFIIISPDVGAGKDCWDAAPARSGERASIVEMVDFVMVQEGADPNRVFAAGASSGACMTNAMMAAYPDVFSGGSVLAGIPAGAWTSGNSCCGTNGSRSPEEWGNIVREAAPSFAGTRPRLQLFHGTGDTTLAYSNLAEEEKQWSDVLEVTDADATMESDQPKAGWSRTSYADPTGAVVLEVVIGQGKAHDLTPEGLWSDVVRFFGLHEDPVVDMGTGGAVGSGGADAQSGGATAAGGETTGIGGALNSIGGSTAAAGGASAAGGALINTAAGGANAAAGGASLIGTGAAPSTGGVGAPGAGQVGGSSMLPGESPGDDESGCQIGRTSRQPFGGLFVLMTAAVGVFFRRRLGRQLAPVKNS